MDIHDLLYGPLFFERNRVSRIYTGGALFADFFGDDPVDGFEPEEWIASSVKALNKISRGEKEGVSRIAGTEWYFDDLLLEYRRELLGDRREFGVLTKLLDSAVRLPVQAHPDKAYSRRHFHSEYGKAESWVILATRPGACIYFGFRRTVSKAEFAAAVERSRTDRQAMVPLLNRIEVKPGDVFFVPARMVHAIGEGCLILEVQEPTDFTIQPEYRCADYALNEQEMYIGLDADTALDVFDYDAVGEAAVAMGRRIPTVLEKENGVLHEALIRYEDTPCFAVERYTVQDAAATLPYAPAVYVVTAGCGTVTCGERTYPVRQGDYFFLPYAASSAAVHGDGRLEIIACLPPQREDR